MNDQRPMVNQQVVMSLNQSQIFNPHVQQRQEIVNRFEDSKMLYSSNTMSVRSRVKNFSKNQSENPQFHSQMQQQPPLMIGRSYGMWPPAMGADQMKYQNPNVMTVQGFVAGGKQLKNLGPRSNWKGRKVNKKDRRIVDSGRRKEKSLMMAAGYMTGDGNELQYQNRLKAKRFFPKKKFYRNNSDNMGAPFAPRNTSSFIIRAKKSGGITSLVSPCPVTPAVLPTPNFSPSREVLVDMAKEEWGVDGYGSMKGLIRLRSPGHEMEEEEEGGGGSSESDVEERVEVERRLDHDLSRFEMIYPNSNGVEYNNVFENRVDDQDSHIAQLEEENLILKERLFLMEREFGDLKKRLQSLERQGCGYEEITVEVVESFSEMSESRGESHYADENNVEFIEQNMEELDGDVKSKEDEMNDGNIESVQKKVEKGNEELNPTPVDEPRKTDIIAHAGTKCESNEGADVRDEKKVEVTQINKSNESNIKSSDNAGVEDKTMEDASLVDAKAVVQANTEDEEPGNE
ncbi:hypothetical protein HAX54_023862 [Datura stramonium]|uniref:PRLI-interacting factor A n=1 Tax=Datura stramonium TaxID=4076 RepID=A0ABS8RK11_DATST|nr:hypothetical protein [Datura stramonium]